MYFLLMDIISNLENTADLEFDNAYTNEVIEKFSLTPILCHKCNDLSKYFLDPSYHINKKYIENARWVLNANAVNSMDIDPYRSLKLPIFDVSNIGVQHPSNRPMGKIHLVRQASQIHEKNTFVRTARYSSLSALKKLKNKPHMSKELAFKLSQDVDS